MSYRSTVLFRLVRKNITAGNKLFQRGMQTASVWGRLGAFGSGVFLSGVFLSGSLAWGQNINQSTNQTTRLKTTTQQITQSSTTQKKPSKKKQDATRAAARKIALRDRAWREILAAFKSPQDVLRANAIEAATMMPDRCVLLIEQALDDSSPMVRFAALVSIGKLKLDRQALKAKSLWQDPNESVRAAAIFAMARCFGSDRQKDPFAVDISPLAVLLTSDNPSTRSNIAMLLGLLGDRSAIALIREASRLSMPRVEMVRVRLVSVQLAEALVLLGDEGALDAIRAGLYSPFEEVRVLSVATLGQLNDRLFLPAIKKLLESPSIELQLVASRALARLGNESGQSIMLKQTAAKEEVLRALATISLGFYSDKASVMIVLKKMLGDRSPRVRLAAAAAVLAAGHPH